MPNSRVPGIMAEVRSEMAKRHERAGFVVEGRVKRKAPVDKGLLRASYTHSADEEGVVVGTNIEYAAPVELGHRTEAGTFVQPQPHLVPGLLESIPELKAIYGAEAD